MIGATSIVAMLWMFADILVPESAIDLFNLTFASASVIFIGLAFPKKWRLLTLPFAAAIGVLYVYITSLNLNETIWMKDPFILPAMSIGIVLIAVYAAPNLFDRFRSLKGYALALITPAACFLYHGVLT